ncbi:hypothetical protein IHE49_03480 [Rhodanobacter sp. 7MK24]|uniref:hypothetical protein n=1 Tax=Rhodanobacter sp. 7MK24 TaxID=2775922 RepID=UPI00177AB173|nr:hypothetical protein [Rhodanobacter sp. 7MK24]MBD8879538.1 hypothetical protein [Rhodanobacter sp. 7MK24]
MASLHWRIVMLVIVVALVSGGAGFYFGIGKGAEVMGAIASQNRVYEALGDVRRSMTALESNDAILAKKEMAVDLRIALFSLGAYSSAVPYIRCKDKDRQALELARGYVAANADARVFGSAPELQRGLDFCVGRQS